MVTAKVMKRTQQQTRSILSPALGLLLLAINLPASATDWIYTVRPGDNIWNLTEEYLTHIGYWRRLQQLNNVQHPKRIPPGTKLRMPVAWLKVQPAPVAVLEVQGEAFSLGEGDVQPRPLSVGMELQAGSRVTTGSEGTVILRFGDGSKIQLKAESRLELDRVSAYGKTGMVDSRMRLQHGRMEMDANTRKGPATRYEITTPSAVSAVRGTRFRVSAEAKDAVSRTEVLQGGVAVSGAGVSRRVPENYGTVVRGGSPPIPPRKLLPPPDLQPLTEVFDRVPVGLQWTALKGAQAYRVQISADPGFETPLFDRTTPRHHIQGPDLDDGDYHVRVRAIDDLGLEGRDAEKRILVDARPEPPVLVEPEIGSTVRDQVPTFHWSRPEDAASFHLQVAMDSSFTPILLDQPAIDGSRFTPQQLQPGSYYWRLATRNRSGELGPYSDPQVFTLRPTPESPEMEQSEIAADDLIFRWRKGLPGQSYVFQFADDADFADILVSQAVAEPTVSVARPQAGTYYLRIATVDVDGFQGPFGTPQRLDVPLEDYVTPILVTILLALIVIL